MLGRIGTARGQMGTQYHYSETLTGQYLPLPPPALQHYTVRLRECLADLTMAPKVFEAMLHDEEFHRDVNSMYNKEFVELLRGVGCKWLRMYSLDILSRGQRAKGNGADTDPVEDDGAGAAAASTAGHASVGANEVERVSPNSDRKQRSKVASNDYDVYKELRSMLLLLTVMGSPYRVVRDEGCLSMSCNIRLLLCRDPSLVYLGLLINFTQPHLPDKALDGVAVMRVIAHGWGASPTFEDIVRCSLQARRRGRQRTGGCSQQDVDAAVLQLPNLVKDPLRILHERILQRTSRGGTSHLDPVPMCRTVLQNMAEAAGDPGRLLWWCRCRLLCAQLLPSSDREEVLAGPLSDFFRSVWRTERLFSSILEEAELDDDAGGGGGEDSAGGAVPSAAMLVGTIADIAHAWHFALRGCAAISGLLAIRYVQNPLDSVNCVVPQHRRFQEGSYRCLADDWQYRLLTEYHSTHLALFTPTNSTGHASVLPAMVAQLTDILRLHPHYCPVLLMRSLALTGENTNISIALNHGLVRAVVTVMRTYMDEQRVSESGYDEQHTRRRSGVERNIVYGWTYEAVRVLRCCFVVLERLATVSTHESINPIVFLLTPNEEDGYELCQHICKRILHRDGHPVLLAAAFRFFSACIHHNVRDVVPALLQRGVLQTILEIGENPTILRRYNQKAGGDPLSSAPVGSAGAEPKGATGVQTSPTSGSPDGRGCEVHAWLVSEEDAAERASAASGRDANAVPPVDPLAYYEQAIPMLDICSVFQAFAVHNSTHAQLHKPQLMWSLLWSLIVPFAPPSPSAPSTGVPPLRVNTRAATAAGKDVISLLRTLPELRDSFFEAFSETLKSLVAASQRQNPPEEVALSMWNIIACLSGAEFRQLSHRIQHRRQRNYAPDHNSLIGEMLTQKLVRYKLTLSQAIRALLQLPHRISVVSANCSVLSLFVCNIPLPMLEHISSVIVSHVTKIAEIVQTSGSAPNGGLSEEQATSLLLLTWAFFCRFHNPSPPAAISKLRCELANALFDTYVALEVSRGKAIASPTTGSNETDRNASESNRTPAEGGGTALTVSRFSTPAATSVPPLSEVDSSVEWPWSFGTNHSEDSFFLLQEERSWPDATAALLTGGGDAERGVLSTIDRFRESITLMLQPPPDRRQQFYPPTRAYRHHGFPSANQQFLLPVSTAHLLSGAEKALKEITQNMMRAVQGHLDAVNETAEGRVGGVGMQRNLRVIALDALNISQLKEVEMRMRLAEGPISIVWRNGGNADGGFTALFTGILACLQFITEGIMPLRKGSPSLASSSAHCAATGATTDGGAVTTPVPCEDGQNVDKDEAVSAKLSTVISSMTRILELLLKTTPERSSTRRHWVQPLLYFMLAIWRAHGLAFTPAMALGVLARLFDFSTDIFDGSADRSLSAFVSHIAESDNEDMMQLISFWSDLLVQEGGSACGEDDHTAPESARSLNEYRPNDAAPFVCPPVSGEQQQQQRPRLSWQVSLAECAREWVLDVASTLRFADGVTEDEQKQMRRLCCRVCWIYTTLTPQKEMPDRAAMPSASDRPIILLPIIRRILEDPGRNYTLLEMLAVLISQEETEKYFIALFRKTQLPRAIFDCVTAEVRRLSDEALDDACQVQGRRLRCKAMLGQLFCFLSVSSANTLSEKKMRVCAYYRSSPSNFCWMGHLCRHLHPQNRTPLRRQIKHDMSSNLVASVTLLLKGFGYNDAGEEETPSEKKSSDPRPDEGGGNDTSGSKKADAEASVTNEENTNEDPAGQAVAFSPASMTSAGSNTTGNVVRSAPRVELRLSDVLGITSILPEDLLLQCAELVLDFLADEDAGMEEQRQEQEQEGEEGQGGNIGGSRQKKKLRELHVLETPVTHIAVDFLSKILGSADTSLVSHLYQLNETTKKGFMVRAISRLLRNDMSGSGLRVPVMKALLDQTEHTEWVVYSAMVSAVQNEIRMGSTYTLQEKDVHELCARHAPHVSAWKTHHSRGIAEVHRQAIVLSDFFVALRSVIDKHPKAFYTVFNASCVVFILHVGNRGVGQESVKTTVWLAPRKPPRQNVIGGSRTPHRLAVEKVFEMLIQRLEGRTLMPPLVTSVLNHITTLPSVASIVTSYNVNVRIPESMQGVFAECKASDEEQAQQQQLTDAPASREAPLFLTPFLAVILFMEKSQLELLEGFFFNVAQKAPSRLVHVLLHALEVMLAAIPPRKDRSAGEAEGAETASPRNPSPSDMACSFLHVLRVLLGAPRSSLVWRLCDELWQRDALEVLYRMVGKNCCNNERDAAALLLVVRRVLLAYGKCNSTHGKKGGVGEKKAAETDGRPDAEGYSGRSGAMASLQQQGQPPQPPQGQQPPPSSAESMVAHEASMLLLEEGDISRTPRTQPSGGVDEAFFLEDLVSGHDQRGRSGELDGIRESRLLQTRHEGTLTEVMFDIGEMLRPNESVLLYHTHDDPDGDSDHDHNEDTVNSAEEEENDEGDVDIVGEEVEIPGHAPTPISMRVGLQDNMSGDDDDDDDDDNEDNEDDDDDDADEGASEENGDNEEEEEEEEGEEGEEDEEEEDLEELSYVIDHPPFLRATPNDMAGVVSGGLADEFGDDGLTSSQLRGLAEWEYDHYTTTLNRIPIDDDDWTLLSGHGHAAILEIIGRHRRETMELNYSGVSGGDRQGVLSRIVSLCEAINEAVDLLWDNMLMLEPLPPVLHAAESEPPRVIPPPLPPLFSSAEENSGGNDAGAVETRQPPLSALPFEPGAPNDRTPQWPGGSTEQGAGGTAAPTTTADTTTNATGDNNSRVDGANARICALFFNNAEPAGGTDPTVPPPSSSSLLSVNANVMGERGTSAPSVAGVGENMSLFGNASSTAETVVAEPPMEQQPWFGEIEPHFLVELPESFRRELLFDHMNLLLCGQEREEGGQHTRIYAAFMNQLPPDVRMEAIEVEHRWRRVTGDETGSGGAQGGDAPSFLTEVLATVDAEVRRDILLTCDLRYLEGNAALLAEATVLRELQSMEAQGGDDEDDRRLRERREEGEGLGGDGAAEGAIYNELFQVPAEDPHLPWFLQHQFLEDHGGRLLRPTGAEAPLISFRDNNNNAGGGGGNRRPGRPPRGHNRVTESFLTTRIRALQSRFTREEKVPPPPNRQNGETGAHAPVPPVPSAVLRQLMELICFAKGGFPSLEYGCASSSLSVSSQLVVLLITVCGNTASATEALVHLLTVALEGPSERTAWDAAADGRPGLDRSRTAVQVVFVIEKLIERCRAAGLSFTMLPDGVEEGGPLKPVDEPYSEAEQQAMDTGLLRRLMEVILRFPSPRAELSFTRILSALNAQLRALEDGTVKVRSPREQSPMPLSNTLIMHPRHTHRLQWTSLCQYPCPDGSFLCDCCGTKLFHDTFAFCCTVCHYVLCPQCSLVPLTADEEAQRIRRCAYALVNSNGTLQTAARLLSHPNCTSEMGLQTVQLLRRGIKESARRDTSVGDHKSPIAVVERIIVDLAKELTAEIHTRVNAFRNAFSNKTAMGGPGTATFSSSSFATGGDAAGREWTTQEASFALSYLNLRCTTSQSHALFLPYAETLRPEQREVSLMWHASQMYLAEVASILQRLQNRSSVLLPHAVLLLLNRFCQFHMAEARRGSCSASLATESHSAPSVEKTETERFMLDTTHTPSSVSDAAVSALARAKPKQPPPPPHQAHHQQQPLRQTGRSYQQQRSTLEGETTETSDLTRDERPALPRLVRQFVERNKTTINTLIQYDPKLLEESFSFLKAEPGFIDFNIRLLDFQRHINHTTHGSRISLSISRDQCLRDSFAQLSKLKTFHGSLNVRFRGEEGADAGGLTREWFQLLAEEMVNDDYALFIHSREGMTYRPNPFSDVNPNHLQYFKFAGTVVGMAVAHSVPIDVHFTRAVYRHMTGVQPIFRDLESVDPELYDNLNWLLRNDVNDLGLFFTVSCERFGVIQETELVPNGAHVAVTNSNKSQYVRLRCEFHMTRQIEQQMEEFLKGFYTVIPRKEIRNFTAQELELVICGMPDIDVEDLRVHTLYDGYTATSPQIRWFWEVVASMTKEDRANLLQFATGASKVPHGGFSNLESASGATQRFTITRWGDSVDLLPQAHTCFNKIDLPEYPSCEELRRKLMLAITFGSRGFSML